jgi:hypothetical protein
MTRTRKSTRYKLAIPIIVLLALILAACASTGSSGDYKKRSELLSTSVEAFNGAVKWEDYSAAATFVPPGKKDEFWAEVDRFKGKVRIVEYQIRELENEEKSCSATVILYFQYWRTDSPTVQNLSINQKWYYIEKEKQWKLLDSGLGAMTMTRTRGSF